MPHPAILSRRAMLAGIAAAVVAPAAHARPGPQSFAPLARQVTPSVLNIAAVVEAPQRPQQGRAQVEEFMRRFGETRRPKATQRATSMGSGFIVDPGGIVVTNNHVVAGASEIAALSQSGRSWRARLVGRDEKTDLAVLKLESSDSFPFVPWGDSDGVEVGDWVLAVGNPFGLGGTVTAGIVSARGRDLHAGPYDDFLQIDAPINSGNSGGPSFNLDGEVIGVNTAIYTPSGGSVGIGFAIPSNIAREIVSELVRSGRVERGWLGVSVQDLTPQAASRLGLKPDMDGVLVGGVDENGPAARGGLRQGDVIVALDGRRIEQVRDVPRAIAAMRPGTRVRLTLLRRSAEVDLEVTTGRMPD